MDLPTALMMTATALYQEVESPLGHTVLFDGDAGEDEEDPLAALRQERIDSIAETFRQLEDFEIRRGEDMSKTYEAMRELSERFQAERR